MSLIGIASDSHDRLENIARAVGIFEREGCGMVLHAGDIISPFALKAFLKGRFELFAVFGNNDGERPGLRRLLPGLAEGPMEIETPEGKRILVTHEPDSLPPVEACARFDLVVFGHTHKASLEERGGTLYLNPGEICGYLTGRATVGIWDEKTGEARIIGI